MFQEGILRGIFRRQQRNTKCSRSGLWSRSALRSRTGIASPHARKSDRGYSDQWDRRPQLRWLSRTRATRRPQERVRCLRSRCRATAARVPVLSGPMSFLFVRSRSNPRWNSIGSPEDRLNCSQSGQVGALQLLGRGGLMSGLGTGDKLWRDQSRWPGRPLLPIPK